MSEESAAPVGDDNSEMKPGEETMSQDQEEVCNKDTELMMLEGETIEDEKMPSYMNATSISSSTKPDDSRTENDGQTQPQFETNESTGEQERNEQNSEGDRSNSSVVELVTSGEESDRGFDGVEDEEDYTTDDDGRDFDDEDDEEEAEYLRRNNDEDDDEDYSESEIEAEQFERSSDDFVQRPSEVLESQARERSRSLQDLTSPTRRIGKFNSNRQHSELDGRADFNLGGQRRCFLGGPKYGHITSKVKQYIHGMKEQSRLSRQRRSRDPLDVNRELANVIKRDQAMETDIRVNPQSRLLKSYMENNMKHMIVEDPTRAEDMTVNRHLVENGAEIISVDTGETLKKSYDTTMVMEVDKENEICPDKHQHQLDKKPNGVMIVDYPGLSPVEPKPSVNLKDNQEVKVETLTNGKDEMKQITNCQSVSYEDFIKGNFDGNQDQKTEKQRKPPSDPLELTAIIQENMSAAPSALKIQQGEPISQEIVISTRNPTENPAVVLLKAQLNKKVVECDGIKEDYKRIVNKNFQLRNDYNLMADKNLQLEKKLSDLTKTLAQYQKEKTKEMRAVEVQTEPLSTVIDKSLVVSQPKVEQEKMSNNSFRSIGSGPSSIEQWTDSNCSPSISLKPPNVGSILNSDDSLCLGTPPKTTPRPISQAFYTSSRILQTLANITQGKSDPANPNTGGRRNNAPGQSKEPISPLVTNEYRSRKRKASECFGTPGVDSQLFKMPFLSNKLRRESNSGYETDAGDKTTVESPASHKNDGNKRDEDDVEEIEVNDGIKCYVYKEDMDSKERSFLLQAEETNKIGNNGVVRECGPFLLANLEVRMSEANGTLNIWGREINQESTSVDVEGADLEEDVLGNEAFWPKTPAEKLRTTPFVCSTNKKQKSGITTAGIRSRVPKKLRTVLNRVAGSYDDQVDRPFGSMPNLDNPGVQNCLSCHQKQGGHSPIQMAPRKSSCCPHNHEVNNYECETVQNTCGAVHNMTCRGISVSNPANLHVKHSCMNYAQNEVCKHQLSSHPLTGDTEEIYCQVPKRCHSIDIPCNSRGENNCPRGRAHSDGQPVFVGDTAPLMQSGSSEGSDNSNRRLSGKRVRGFLRDFLKGCGDCRHSHTTSLNTGHLQASETPIPDIRITAAPDSGLHHQPHSSSNDRAPNSIADFQLQFEQLMVDVEKINTRSRTLFQMMNTLCNVDSQ